MASSGSHTGVPLSDSVGTLSTKLCPDIPETHLSLEEYWEFLQINECAGYGIRNYPTTGFIGMGCGDYWNQRERVFLAYAIQKAESRLEADRWLGFPVRRKYYSGRQLEYAFPVTLGKWVRGIGVETKTAITEGKALALRTGAGAIIDPVSFTVNVSFTDIDELVIYYPGQTECKIRPSKVSISSGVATVEIPRCRLLKPDYFQDYADVNDRPDYEDDDYFLAEVDVYWNYLDTTTGANFVWWRHQGSLCCQVDVWTCDTVGVCSDVRQLACGYVSNQRMGFAQFEPATYSDGWTKTTYAVRRQPDGLEIAFMRGYYDRYDDIRADLKRVIIAMAHNNMPQDYCACSVQTHYYKRDTKPLEPPVRLGLGESTWGNFESEQIIREFDKDRYSYAGGLL